MTRIVATAFMSVMLLLGPSSVFSQDEEEPALSGMSRQMRLGIRFYERGEDLQAMDRFMEILTRGDPAERSMANEYINLISHRMNSGAREVPKRPTSLRPSEATVERAPRQTAAVVAAERSARPGLRGPDEVLVERAPVETPPYRPTTREPEAPMRLRRTAPENAERAPRADKALMKREIRAKIRNHVELSLRELREVEGVRLLMHESGDPQAVAIPSPLLFQSGIAFQKEAKKILDALTSLTYGLGSAQVVILPEGTAIGDAKVLDMRRTMGISAHLFTAGIAPPRVKVNLLNTQVNIPKSLSEFKGIVVLFQYNQALPLVVESSIGDEGGPPLSLGIHPATVRPERGEGAIIEFSVQDPPAGLVSWKFQLLQPSSDDGGDLAPLQEVVGGSPVFHQIYWNGRQNYFGAPLSAGRYECVLTATDSKNRQRSLHRWIQVIDAYGGEGAAPRVAARARPGVSASVPAALPAGAPSAELPGADDSEGLIKDTPTRGLEISRRAAAPPSKRAARDAKKKKKAKAAATAPAAEASGSAEPGATADPEAAAAAAEAAKASAGAVAPTKPSSAGFSLDFNRNTHQLTPDGEKRLAQIAETMVYYPNEGLKIVGHASTLETAPANLAEKRAQMVAGLLINKYQVDPKKIEVSSSLSDAEGAKVSVRFGKGQ